MFITQNNNNNNNKHPADIYLETLVFVKLNTKGDGRKGRFEVWCHKVLGSIPLLNQMIKRPSF